MQQVVVPGSPNTPRTGDTLYRLVFPSGVDALLSFDELVERFGPLQALSIRQAARSHSDSNNPLSLTLYDVGYANDTNPTNPTNNINTNPTNSFEPMAIWLILPPLVKWIVGTGAAVGVGLYGYYIITDGTMVAPNINFPLNPTRDSWGLFGHVSRHIVPVQAYVNSNLKRGKGYFKTDGFMAVLKCAYP